MQLTHQSQGDCLVIKAAGRLDASWADHFTDTLMAHIRDGRHHLLIDAADLAFLSSAGIRSLLRIHKELASVNGGFRIWRAGPFVTQTLRMSGFQAWLTEEGPQAAEPSSPDGATAPAGPGTTCYLLDADAFLTLSVINGWRPWERVRPQDCGCLSFPPSAFALGIGGAAENLEAARPLFGEFVAAGGHLAYQPPSEEGRPDYLLSEGSFVPEMQCIQAFRCEGGMSRLLRFSPEGDRAFFQVAEIAGYALDLAGSDMAGFVVLGEIEGLVGVHLIRSPGLITQDKALGFPEIRDWLSFCGERGHGGQTALLAGVAWKAGLQGPASPSPAGFAAHVHGAVFPYQPLPNGPIAFHEMVCKYMTGPPPLGVFHLIDDDRPVVGLGQGALIRGACWCGPIRQPEVRP